MTGIVQQYLSDGSALAYVALFFGIMLENAGIPLPGETALLIAGYLSCESGGNAETQTEETGNEQRNAVGDPHFQPKKLRASSDMRSGVQGGSQTSSTFTCSSWGKRARSVSRTVSVR